MPCSCKSPSSFRRLPPWFPQPIAPPHPLHRDWTDYYQAVSGRPPRETLLFALDRFDRERGENAARHAIDLGCGDGRDTVEILRRGWQVLAIDGSPEAIARLTQRPEVDGRNLATEIQQFATLALPRGNDLLNASFCLQFCSQAEFPEFWTKIVESLQVGGRFSGQLLGDRDSWTEYTNMNFHSRAAVEGLLAGFEVEFFKEEEHPGKTALDEEKYWHIYQIVARKR